MKSLIILPILFAATVIILVSCNSKQTAHNYLKDDNQRKEIVLAMAHHQPYMTEIMNEMINNDTCKQLMGSAMMGNSGMMNRMMGMMMDNHQMQHQMMSNMLNKCVLDSTARNQMGTMMAGNPVMMKTMMQMKNQKGMLDKKRY